MVKHTQEEFIAKLQEIYNDTYDYSRVVYDGYEVPVTLVCDIHGEFLITPNKLLSRKVGCQRCSRRDSKAIFMQKASAVHADKYVDTAVVYITSRVKVCITCPKHGKFWQLPKTHLEGHGCKLCGNATPKGKYSSAPTILYYFKIKDVWKIGITTKSVAERYNKQDTFGISNIITWQFATGLEAYTYEQSIVSKYSKYAYTGTTPFTDGTGTTECFTVDIYKLHNQQEP